MEREHVRVLRKEWEKGVERQRLHSVKCSQCAGTLSVYRGKRLLVCDHCGVRTAVLEAGGVSRWYFPARVDRRAAATAGARWLGDHPGIDTSFRDATLVETQLVYAPIWEHRVLAAGWEFGYRHSNRLISTPLPAVEDSYQPLELQRVQEKVKEPRLHERRFYLPATDFVALGARRPRVTGRELMVPLLAGELEPYAMVLEAEGDGSEVAEAGRALARQPLSGADLPRMHVYLFKETTSLLYYPFWILRYRLGSAFGTVVVNGRHDNVNSAVAPADLKGKKTALAAKIAGLVVLGAVMVYLGVRSEALRPLLALSVVSWAVAVLLGLRFKPEKEVEYHDPYAA